MKRRKRRGKVVFHTDNCFLHALFSFSFSVIDVWKGGNWQDEMAAVTKAGFHSVLSAPFYLNYISYGEDWPKYYSVEPSNFTGGEEADKAGLVGGVEVCMWSEFVDAANFIPREWPRAASVGERGWSNKDVRDVDDARVRLYSLLILFLHCFYCVNCTLILIANFVHFLQVRLHELRCKMIARGINAEPITNGGNRDELSNHNFCPQEWVPGYVRPWDGVVAGVGGV